MTLEGKIVKIYKQTDNWICFRFEDNQSKNQYTAKGNVSGIFMPGMKLTLAGNFVEDKTYGRQIELSSIKRNSSITATFLYKCVKGVGMSLADEIVKTYGEDCIDKIMTDNSLLLKVKGIKEKKFKMITDSLNKTDNIKLYLNIFDYFNNDITQNQADKIVQACNSKLTTFEKIKKNPYWLIEHVNGFGFKKVDKMALSSGMQEFSIERIGAAIVFALQQMSQTGGHCYSDMECLSKEVADLVLEKPEGLTTRSSNFFRKLIESEDDIGIESYLKKNDKDGVLKKWKDDYYHLIDVMSDALIKDIEENLIIIEDERIYWVDLYKAEVSAAKIIMEMAWKVPVKKIAPNKIKQVIADVEKYEGCTLSDEQKNAIETSLKNRISVITGGPGRGKTTIIKSIIEAWDDNENVVLLAPTGRAAKRITESSGYPASTIQRYQNKVKKDEYPEGKLIIVDETSMVGIKLAASILKIARKCNLIFVGDIDQLASIEPGSFMKDIINCGQVAVSKLTKGFRNSGSIALNAALMNKGKHLKEFTLDDHTGFHKNEGESIIATTQKLYGEYLKKYKAKDIGILTPMRSRGYGAVDSLNEAIRNKYNPETVTNRKNGSGFLINDRVMHLRNNYQKEIMEYGIIEHGIFNGDTGTISSINYDLEEVTVFLDDGRIGTFSYEEMKNDFVLSYATTIHKSQGSEYKVVLLITSSQHAFFLKRNLLYTGMTRAIEQLELIGDEKSIAIAARNIDDSVRNTYLSRRIKEIAAA